MTEKSILAFDIGAGSGRAILGTWDSENGLHSMREIYRFPHAYVRVGKGYYWDYIRIYRGILDSLAACAEEGIKPDSIGIDTWAQDYAFIGPSGEVLGLPRCYRDPALDENGRLFEERNGLPDDYLQNTNGSSYGPILTFRQLYYDSVFKKELFENANCFVWMAYLFIYLLTGAKACDISLIGTCGFADVHTLQFSEKLADLAGVRDKFPKIFEAGQVIGYTGEAVRAASGYEHIPVICVESHDTNSAVSAVPDPGEFLWVSNGSFAMYGSVMREACVNDEIIASPLGNVRMADGRAMMQAGSGPGMYHFEQCRKKWTAQGLDVSYEKLTEYALKNRTERTFVFEDVDDTAEDMPGEIADAVEKAGFSRPEGPEEIYEAFCNGLAQREAAVLLDLERMAGRSFERLYIISGGAKADGVNVRLAQLTGKETFAGPFEASAIGNLKAQLIPYAGHAVKCTAPEGMAERIKE